MGIKYKIGSRWNHSKASEVHHDIEIEHEDGSVEEWRVPTVYPRLGVNLQSEDEISSYLDTILDHFDPEMREQWKMEQAAFWDTKNQKITRTVFDELADKFDWLAYKDMSAPNNEASRLKALKLMGYTIATRKISGRDYEFRILPLPRGLASGYETWSTKLRSKIVQVLGNRDVYEDRIDTNNHLLPDHKFPEVRWDADTRRESLEHLSDDEIQHDFQLITNQRNQQKREVCRRCFQTGERGYPFGIKYFYEGDAHWPEDVPKTGKAAETGCRGCGWYDLQAWRDAVSNSLDE